MSATKARQIVLAARPQGAPRLTDFRLEETAVPTPVPGRSCSGSQYLSLDPYMRGRMDDRESYAAPDAARRRHARRDRGDGGRLAPSRLRGRRHRAGPHRLAHACAVGPRGPAQARPGRGPGHDGARRAGDARVHRLRRPALIGKPRPAKPSSSRPRAARSGRWSANSRSSPARGRSASRAAPRSAVREGRARASTRRWTTGAPDFAATAGGGLPERHRRLLRERRRGGLAGGVAAAQHVRARPGLRPDRPVQRAARPTAPTGCPPPCARC